jgi:hypothetical protein
MVNLLNRLLWLRFRTYKQHSQTCQLGSGKRDKRCQSTPAASQSHCARLRQTPASVIFGQTKPPRCNRRWHNQTPLPSHTSKRNRFPALFLNTNATPEHGACPKASWTIIDKPSIPRRISTGATANQICNGSPIIKVPARPPTTNSPIPSQAIPIGVLGRNAAPSS